MKRLILFAALSLAACKEGAEKSALTLAPSSCIGGSGFDTYDLPSGTYVLDSGGLTIGNFIAQDGDCLWVQDAEQPQYHYAVSATTGELRQSAGMVFSDNACLSVIGEVFDYPLHLGGDIYVFEFEGALYEYPLAGMMGFPPGTYYFKAPGGSCDLFTGDPNLVREASLSTFARTFSGPVSL